MEIKVQGTSEVFFNQNELTSFVFLGKILLTGVVSKPLQQFNAFKHKSIKLARTKVFLIFPKFSCLVSFANVSAFSFLAL